MAPRKQVDRNANKKAKQQEEKEANNPPASGDNKILSVCKSLVMESCIVMYAPKLKDLVQDIIKEFKDKGAEKKNGDDSKNGDSKEDEAEDEKEETPKGDKGEGEIFTALKDRLTWHNSLGLGQPFSTTDAKEAWHKFKNLEFDYGPRQTRRGTPKYDRIMANLCGNMTQYLHIVLALMTMRTFFGRSFFALLPWLLALQLASTLVPIDVLPPKVTIKVRGASSFSIHALVWLMFLWEAVWKTYFFEKIAVAGMIVLHAHSVRPAE